MKYFFILGQNPTLSIAEIFTQIETDVKEIKFSNEVLVLKTKKELDYQKLQKRLGGTIKIGKIFEKINKDLKKIDLKIFLDLLKNNLLKKKKVFFGFSLYKLDQKLEVKSWRLKIKNLALKMKKELKKESISSRWVESKENFLSSVIVKKNKLLTDGAEFVFLMEKNNFYLGKTLTCQEFEEYEFFDFKRPKREIKEGMIPIKLAKIMINLAKVSEKEIILDPFCGSGTILQEAILIGYQNIIGTDISQKAIENTKKNIEWLFKNLNIKFQNLKINIFQSDVKDLSKKIPLNSVGAIITEPYLGPLKIPNSKPQILNLINDLSKLYLTTFEEFKKILKYEGKVVIIFPIFRIKNKLYFLPILDELKKLDWTVVDPFPKNFKKNQVIKLTDRHSIIYSRPKQKLLREIFIFKLKNTNGKNY